MDFIFKKKIHNYLFLLLSILVILQYFLFIDLPFFWDAVSKSERASWIYDHNFSQFIVPIEINSGHPPLWITLLATLWALLGKTIWVSRLLLLLINIGVVYQILIFCKENFINTVSILFIFLVILEPTLIAQSTILNNDMLLLFFTLLAINSLIGSRSFLFGLALTGLLFTNLRGIYIFIAIGIIHIFFYRNQLVEKLKNSSYCYVFPIVLFGIFCFYQYKALGWFIVNQNADFNSHRKIVGLKQILINILVFAKSFLEYGRIFLFIFFIPLAYKYAKSKAHQNLKINRLLVMFIVFAIILFLGTVFFSNPFGDRYFMICFIISILATMNLLNHYKNDIIRNVVLVLIVGFITGHFWVYPPTKAQAWDSSLAYLNIYDVERKMETSIDSLKIPRNKIGTRIPLNTRNYSSFSEMAPSDYYSDFDIDFNHYILLSNIENETKDHEFNHIRYNWKLLKCYSNKGVFMSLYVKDSP